MVIGRSSLQAPELLDIDRPRVAEQQHQDRQPDRGFGGGNRQDEEDEDLSPLLMPRS